MAPGGRRIGRQTRLRRWLAWHLERAVLSPLMDLAAYALERQLKRALAGRTADSENQTAGRPSTAPTGQVEHDGGDQRR